MIKWEQGQELLGEYPIENKLGQGGMGRVWLVKSNSTGRRFAVKQAILKDEKTRKAFLAELQTWIDLPEHPNIVPCRFFRTVGDEIVIFTDYIEGGSLKDWIDHGKLTTLEQILDVAIQFAGGLHAIHERGLIHQDVKPGNVLMTSDGVPMVADFGLARARQVAPNGQFVSPDMPPGQQSVLVSVGGMTPAYASPEQKAGQPLSRKTDIWSWGVSVMDMFMGGVSCPHGGHIAADVLEAFCDNGGQEDGLPKMPEDAAGILRKCFTRDSAVRWVNLDATASAAKKLFQKATGRAYLKQVQQDRATQAKPVPHDRQFEGAKWRDPREWLRKAYAANGRDPAEADSYQVPAAYSRKGAAVADLALFEEAERQFKASLSVWNSKIAEPYAGLLFEKAMVCGSLDDAEGYLAAADQSIAIWRRLVEHEGRQELADGLAMALMNKANALQKVGNLAGAVELYDQCIVIRRHLVEQEGWREVADGLAMALMNKANALQKVGDLAGAVESHDQCIAIYRRLVEQEGRRDLAGKLAGTLMNKANALQKASNLAGAVGLYDECISIYRRLVEQEGRQELADGLAKALMNKAAALKSMGNLAGAVEMYDQGIAIYRRLVEQEGRQELANDVALALMHKGNTLTDIGDLAGAVELYDECIVIYRGLVEQEGRLELAKDLATALMNIANALQKVGDLAGAVKLYDQCIAIYRRLVEQEGRRDLANDLAMALMNDAVALDSMGDLACAVELFDECIAIYRRLVEQEGRLDLANIMASALMNKARALSRIGDLAGAVELYDQCIAIKRRLVEQEGRQELVNELATALMNKAVALDSMSDLTGAVELFDESIVFWRRLVEQEGRWGLANNYALALLNKANALKGMDDLAGAVEVYDQSIAIYRRLVEQDCNHTLTGELAAVIFANAKTSRTVADRLMPRYLTEETHERFKQASPYQYKADSLFEECIAIWQGLVEQEGKWELADNLTEALICMAFTKAKYREYMDAARLFDKAIVIAKKLRGRVNRPEFEWRLGMALVNKGAMLVNMFKKEGAIELYDEGIGIIRKLVEQYGNQERRACLLQVEKDRATCIKIAKGIPWI